MSTTAAITVALLFAVSALRIAEAAECHGAPSPDAKPNTNPIQTAPPVFVRSVENGKLYTVGDADDKVPVVHVWGTPYQMGYAQGQLLSTEAQGLINDVWTYMEEQVEAAINGSVTIFPEWFLLDVANLGLDAALDLEILATEAFTGTYFLDEIKGLADATGLDYKKIQRIHMIGELTKGSCSMFGANASATPTGGLLQLRALDWDVDGPFRNYPQITVYHPDEGNGHAFVNLGWTGWIGSISGMSSVQTAISEIGVSFPDDTFGKESRFGTPFTYLLRDILQFDETLFDAMNRISTARRTCDLILGVGDGKIGEFRGVEYSAAVADFITPTTLRPVADWHPPIQDIVYWGMDWLCPGYSSVLARQLNAYHGNITAENTIQNILAIVQTGDLHIAIYDLSNNLLYVSNAQSDGETGAKYAYDRAYIKLDMATIFAESPPTQ
ncbi:hypothetical protein EMCRGX_G029624 [Ephydatia muelleri]|eukprot:Em0013g142a